MCFGAKVGIIAFRSRRCSSPSLRIRVWASNARSIGVVGSFALNRAGLSLIDFVSTDFVINVLLRVGAKVIGASHLNLRYTG